MSNLQRSAIEEDIRKKKENKENIYDANIRVIVKVSRVFANGITYKFFSVCLKSTYFALRFDKIEIPFNDLGAIYVCTSTF